MRTKHAMAALCAGALTLTATACAGSDAESDSDTIHVLLNNNGIGDRLALLVEDFSEQSGIEVEVEVLAEQQMRDRQLLNLQSRSTSMDVFMTLPSREGPLYLAEEYYEPLDDLIGDSSDEWNSDDFSEIVMDGMTVDGSLVAIPMNVEGPIMYYREDLLAEAGVDVPETVDDLMAAAEALDEVSDGSWDPVTLRGQTDALAYDFGPFFHANGLEWATDGVPNFDDDRAVEAIDQYATLASQYGPDGVINYSFNESTNLFASGGAAILLESSNLLPTVVDENTSVVADNTGAATIPGGVPAILSWGLAISPFSEQTEEAWEFVEWATSTEVQLSLGLEGIAPARASLYDDAEYTDSLSSPLEEQWSQALVDLMEVGHTEVGPVSVQAPEIRRLIGDSVGAVILEQQTAEEAAASLQEQLEPILQSER